LPVWLFEAKIVIFVLFKVFWSFLFLKKAKQIMAFFEQFNFYVGLTDLKMILTDFRTRNDKFVLETALEFYTLSFAISGYSLATPKF